MLFNAAPFSISLLFPVLIGLGLYHGGLWIEATAVFALLAVPIVDHLVGLKTDGLDPRTEERRLFWHKFITWLWLPIQVAIIFAIIAAAGHATHLSTGELVRLALACGLITGGIGITYAHELVHQTNRFERGLGEALLTTTLYGHFAIEHVHGHHTHVGTPRDPVTARYGESFYRFFPRAVIGSLVSAWRIQRERMARRGLKWHHVSNPFWRYAAATVLWLGLSYGLAGWFGVALFVLQAFVAFTLLEIVNYVEHYGLTRQLLENGRYERVGPHHSWNASHRVTNYLLINLQRHSDHHYHPGRRFPLLQHYDEAEAPQLPFGYPTMLSIALLPPLWFRVMNPRVEQWRARHYPGHAFAAA
jgi:alkane 1-monooxygenase